MRYTHGKRTNSELCILLRSLPVLRRVRNQVFLSLVGWTICCWIAGAYGLAEQAETSDAAEQRRHKYESYALTHAGDPEKGRWVFQHDPRAKCKTCHRVGDDGGAAGPELTWIGGKFDRPHLIESLLEPSRQIVEGYRSVVLVTADGQSVTGILTQESHETLQIVDAESKLLTLPARDIEQRRTSKVSLMPEGLATQLSLQQFADLVAYLESLRDAGNSPGAAVAGPVRVPPGFRVQVVATGLSGATALEVLPDSRLLVCEQAGTVRVIMRDRLLDQPFVTLPVDSSWERGVLGVTVDPSFPAQPYVYVCWVARDPYPHHRISRFTASGNVAAPDSEVVLLVGDDQGNLGGNVPAGHQGGALHFGSDGKLYVAIGEQTAELPAQRLDTLQGKMLRLNRDGSIPADNPFVEQACGKYRAIWAIGCRNPFTFAFDKITGRMWINDVGGKFEEINPGVRGANYGWPLEDHGPTSRPDLTDPIHFYPQASIAGGDFSGTSVKWPAEYRRRYFFADFVHGWIKTLDPDHPETAEDFATGLRRPVDLRFAGDGTLYVLLRNAWVIDNKFTGGTSSLMRISPVEPGGH
jgi:putative heme-binding domain-containing protein